MKRRFLSFLLALAMCLPLCVPAFAADLNVSDELMEKRIQAEIQSEKERIFASVYEQLEAQDALSLMDIYVEILTPKIEASVLASYGVKTASTRASSYRFANGGTLGYNSISDSVVLDTYYTKDQYTAYCNANADVEDGSSPISISNILSWLYKHAKLSEDTRETINGWGAIFKVLVKAQGMVDDAAQDSVARAGGFANIISVSAAGGSETGTTVIGWKNQPMATLPPIATNVHVQMF